MSYYPEPDSHIADKVKVVLDLLNFETKEELDHATGVDTSDFAAKKLFCLKAENDKLDISKLINVLISLNNFYHHSICKKPSNADYSALNEKIETNPKLLKFKLNDRVRIAKYKNIFSKGYTENCSREIFIINQ